MKKQIFRTVLVLAVVAAVLLLSGSLYTVNQKQYAAVRQFGRIVRVEKTPGLKMKLPFIQSVQRVNDTV